MTHILLTTGVRQMPLIIIPKTEFYNFAFEYCESHGYLPQCFTWREGRSPYSFGENSSVTFNEIYSLSFFELLCKLFGEWDINPKKEIYLKDYTIEQYLKSRFPYTGYDFYAYVRKHYKFDYD